MNAALHTATHAATDATIDTTAAPAVVRNVVKTYDERRILDGVSLTLEAGTVLGLIGRNGAGKSTLIRALLGQIEPEAGDCAIWGEPALRLGDAAKARIGYVPQQPESLGWMTTKDMLAFVGRFYPRWDQAFVEATLQRWQLPVATPLSKLSPGERQRVAILRALASQPELLILDEPAAALDPVARRDLLREIATRAGEFGTTVLFSTHIVSDLERVASHVAFMHAGRMQLQAELDTLKERHLRLHIPAAAAGQWVGPIPGEVGRRPNPYGGLTVVVIREEGQPWPALVDAPGVQREHMSLEDLFVEVAG